MGKGRTQAWKPLRLLEAFIYILVGTLIFAGFSKVLIEALVATAKNPALDAKQAVGALAFCALFLVFIACGVAVVVQAIVRLQGKEEAAWKIGIVAGNFLYFAMLAFLGVGSLINGVLFMLSEGQVLTVVASKEDGLVWAGGTVLFIVVGLAGMAHVLLGIKEKGIL